MKKYLLFIFNLSFMVSLFSCKPEITNNNFYDNDYVKELLLSSKKTSFSSEKKYYTVYTYSENNQVDFSSIDENKSRTVLPLKLSVDDLDFYMEGKNMSSGTTLYFTDKDGNTTSLLKVNITGTADDGSCGTFSINLPKGYCTLTMYAVKKGKPFDINNISKNTVLTGGATVASSVDDIKFYLSGKTFLNASGMSGDVTLGIYTDGWRLSDYNDSQADFTCTVGIYKKTIKSEMVYEETDYNIPSYNSSSLPSKLTFFSKIFKCVINPGEYNLIICFTNKKTGKKFYYSDVIMVYGNQTISTTVAVPDILTKRPDAPENMVCGYINPSDENAGKYNIDVEWDDVSTNEAYFELELMDLEYRNIADKTFDDIENIKCILGKSDIYGDGARDIIWEYLKSKFDTFVISNKYFEEKGLVASGDVKGSLSVNSSGVVFSIPFGTKYLMRMCAVNEIGKSSYVYPDIYSDSYRYSNVHPWHWEAEDDGNCNYSINRYEVMYNFNNGIFYDTAKSINVMPEKIMMNKVQYASESANGLKLLSPLSVTYFDNENNEFTASLGQIVDGNFYPWLGWKEKSATGNTLVPSSEIDSYRYKNYKSLNLFASFDQVSTMQEGLSIYQNLIVTEKGVEIDRISYGVPGFKICAMPSATSTFAILTPYKANDDTIKLSKSSCDTLFMMVLDEYYKVNISYGKHGSIARDLGESAGSVTADWKTLDEEGTLVTERYTHQYWAIPIADKAPGTYFINISAKKYELSDPMTYYLVLEIE